METHVRPRVEIEGLRVVRGGSRVLDNLSLSVTEPITALVGANGAGKSTLLRVLATLLPISSGRVEVVGENVATRAGARTARRHLGFLPQEPTYLTTFTTLQSLRYAAWLHGVPRSDQDARVESIIADLGLGAERSTRLSALSGGTRRRVYIAQAVVHLPEVMLMDEPTVGIDAAHRVELRRLIRHLSAGRCVLMSTHMTEDIELLADRVIVLRAGRIVFEGTPKQLQALSAGGSPSVDVRAIEESLRQLGALA